MRITYVTPAIVLRTWSFGESDKIVSFLTEKHGKVIGIAKGAKRSKRRFVNSLEPFSLVILRFQDRPHTNLAFILACDLQSSFKRLVTGLERIAYASYLVEITDGLVGEREENRLIFELLREGLTHIEEKGISLTFVTAFELKLLRLAGYQPVLDSCRRCGKARGAEATRTWHFSPRDGGVLCQLCSKLRKEILPMAAETIEVLTRLQNETTELSSEIFPSSSVLKELRSVVVRFVQHHIDREIKSASFLYQFSST